MTSIERERDLYRYCNSYGASKLAVSDERIAASDRGGVEQRLNSIQGLRRIVERLEEPAEVPWRAVKKSAST